MSALIHTQILRVMLFGPLSLSKKRPSGPTSNRVQWRVREATPGMIALAAMIVEPIQLQNHQQSWLLHLHKMSAMLVPALAYIGCTLQG